VNVDAGAERAPGAQRPQQSIPRDVDRRDKKVA
jgi:hypothetical protein